MSAKSNLIDELCKLTTEEKITILCSMLGSKYPDAVMSQVDEHTYTVAGADDFDGLFDFSFNDTDELDHVLETVLTTMLKGLTASPSAVVIIRALINNNIES